LPHSSANAPTGRRQHTKAFVSIREHALAYVSTLTFSSNKRLAPLFSKRSNRLIFRHSHLKSQYKYVSRRQQTSAYVSIRQHTSAYVSIRLSFGIPTLTALLSPLRLAMIVSKLALSLSAPCHT
jgi:hypothetical protein